WGVWEEGEDHTISEDVRFDPIFMSYEYVYSEGFDIIYPILEYIMCLSVMLGHFFLPSGSMLLPT
ncbi:MAG: hypothetical protein AB4058_02425, partial [Microcystaceae cyanobacterium]